MPVHQQSQADALLARLKEQRTAQQLNAIAKLLVRPKPVQSRRSAVATSWKQRGSLANLRAYHRDCRAGRIPGVPRCAYLPRRSAQEVNEVRAKIIDDLRERPKPVVGIIPPRRTRASGLSPLCYSLTLPSPLPARALTAAQGPAVDEFRISGALMCLASRKRFKGEQWRSRAINRSAILTERTRLNSGPPATPTTPSPPGRRCLVEPVGPRQVLCVTAPAPRAETEKEKEKLDRKVREVLKTLRPAPPRTPTRPARAEIEMDTLDLAVRVALATLPPIGSVHDEN